MTSQATAIGGNTGGSNARIRVEGVLALGNHAVCCGISEACCGIGGGGGSGGYLLLKQGIQKVFMELCRCR